MNPVQGKRRALIVATDEYNDPKLKRLRAPARDAKELGRVLREPSIGDFQVTVVMNEPEHKIRRAIAALFKDCSRADVVLLHLACHGVKDEDGNLYFATVDTEEGNLDPTAVSAEWVNRQMTRSRSQRVLLLLDCCFSGAFAHGFIARGDRGIDIKERFEGRGRVVLTASNAMEYAWEGNQLSGGGTPSVFTGALVDGLETGAADRDGDGRISVDELYDYVHDRVREVTPNQTPGKWAFDVQGELYVARSAHTLRKAELPAELRGAIDSPLASVRQAAVSELRKILHGSDSRLRPTAEEALHSLLVDDSRMVSGAAAAALAPERPASKEIAALRPIPQRRPHDATKEAVVDAPVHEPVASERGHEPQKGRDSTSGPGRSVLGSTLTRWATVGARVLRARKEMIRVGGVTGAFMVLVGAAAMGWVKPEYDWVIDGYEWAIAVASFLIVGLVLGGLVRSRRAWILVAGGLGLLALPVVIVIAAADNELSVSEVITKKLDTGAWVFLVGSFILIVTSFLRPSMSSD
jgi:uncharacterized caspase-like protein